MTPVDLHPEDLLEREIRGELSPAEEERLDRHARQCTVCRLERRARDDFRIDDESPEAEADVARLLAAMAGPLALQGLHRTAKASPMRYLRFVSVAAAVVTMTGLAAAAAGWSEVRAVVMPWTVPTAQVAPAKAKAQAPLPVVRIAVAAPAFHRASEARAGGDHPRAGKLFGMLLNRYPSAPEAHAALALFGRILLDDGNAYGALQCFDDYLRTGGALREDVMLGRAIAFQRIGPRASADEARAWTSLIDAYPGSVHAERARRRLSELSRL